MHGTRLAVQEHYFCKPSDGSQWAKACRLAALAVVPEPVPLYPVKPVQ